MGRRDRVERLERKVSEKRAANVASETGQDMPQQENGATKRGRGWGLSTLPSCRRRLARLLSDIDDGTIDDLVRARTLIYGISHVIACLKFEAELEVLHRIEALEAAAAEVKRR